MRRGSSTWKMGMRTTAQGLAVHLGSEATGVLVLNLNAKIHHRVRSRPKTTTVHLRQDKHPVHLPVGPHSWALRFLSAPTAPSGWLWLWSLQRETTSKAPLPSPPTGPAFHAACSLPCDAPTSSTGCHLDDTRTPSHM